MLKNCDLIYATWPGDAPIILFWLTFGLSILAFAKRMNQPRIDLLKKFILEDPCDPFNYYALALEHLHTDPLKAGELFDNLLNEHPNYLPTYYMAGTFFASQKMEAKGLGILKKGLLLAKLKQNFATARELLGAIQNMDE